MAESISFSVNLDNILQIIRPRGQLQTSLPFGLDNASTRRHPFEVRRAWFIRLVDQFCNSDVELVKLEDCLGVFVYLGWRNRNQLSYASIQTIYTTCDLSNYYLGEECEEMYLRLDFDYQSLGHLFSHPLAHIHVEGALSPRFALEGGNSGNIIMDYFEFLYRTYFPEKWLEWVDRVWSQEFVQTAMVSDINPFDAIVAAFTDGIFASLRTHAQHIERLKSVLRRRKDELFNCHMDGQDRVLLEYPSAR